MSRTICNAIDPEPQEHLSEQHTSQRKKIFKNNRCNPCWHEESPKKHKRYTVVTVQTEKKKIETNENVWKFCSARDLTCNLRGLWSELDLPLTCHGQRSQSSSSFSSLQLFHQTLSFVRGLNGRPEIVVVHRGHVFYKLRQDAQQGLLG